MSSAFGVSVFSSILRPSSKSAITEGSKSNIVHSRTLRSQIKLCSNCDFMGGSGLQLLGIVQFESIAATKRLCAASIDALDCRPHGIGTAECSEEESPLLRLHAQDDACCQAIELFSDKIHN